ncbi:hypothetical protein ACP70R_020357 [Stipagrostis hirtigluma subsp. patula]
MAEERRGETSGDQAAGVPSSEPEMETEGRIKSLNMDLLWKPAEGPAKKAKTEDDAKKKRKVVVRRLTTEEVERVLAMKPTPRLSPALLLKPKSEELRLQFARTDEMIRCKNEFISSVQEQYRHHRDTYGYVDMEVLVTDDDEPSPDSGESSTHGGEAN